ncbi:MAG: hypothetical protein ACE5JP_12345 [Candidatus Bipolaricaulia bacterium]
MLIGEHPSLHDGRLVFHTLVGSATVIRIYELDSGQLTNTEVVGENPRLWGDKIAFETQERQLGEDLNGDGNLFDRIIHVYDIPRRTVTNTGAVGMDPTIYGDIVAFSTSEERIGEDLDGDGVLFAQVIRYYDLNSGTVHNTGVVGAAPAIYERTIAFQTEESIVGRDLNDDFDAEDVVIRLYHLDSERITNTKAVGAFPAIYGDRVAFHTLEFGVEDLNDDGDLNDFVIRVYDLRTQGVTNTSTLGVFPVVYENRLAFATDEERAGQDFNNDGVLKDFVLRSYDLIARDSLNTSTVGMYPSLDGNVLAYQLEERRIGKDLTRDGDTDDTVIRLISLNERGDR